MNFFRLEIALEQMCTYFCKEKHEILLLILFHLSIRLLILFHLFIRIFIFLFLALYFEIRHNIWNRSLPA